MGECAKPNSKIDEILPTLTHRNLDSVGPCSEKEYFEQIDSGDHLAKLVLDTKTWKWIEIDYNFISIETLEPSKTNLDLSCTTIIDKKLRR